MCIIVTERSDRMEFTKDWQDYEIIDASRGEKLERWGNIYFLSPDPQIIGAMGIYLKNIKVRLMRYIIAVIKVGDNGKI